MMTASEMGKKGGRRRWRGTTKRQRSSEMSRIIKIRWSRRTDKPQPK